MREGQVRGHRLLRVGLVVGALLLVQRCRFLAQHGRMIVFLAVVVFRVVEQKVRIFVVGGGGGGRRAAQQTVMMMRMMRMVGDEQRTAVHYDTGNSHQHGNRNLFLLFSRNYFFSFSFLFSFRTESKMIVQRKETKMAATAHTCTCFTFDSPTTNLVSNQFNYFVCEFNLTF